MVYTLKIEIEADTMAEAQARAWAFLSGGKPGVPFSIRREDENKAEGQPRGRVMPFPALPRRGQMELQEITK